MKTIKGPALFLAQFAGDEAPFNSWDAITKWAADCGYKGVQVPSWDGRLIDLAKAAESKDYCDEFKGVAAANGVEVNELSTHLQGQLVAVHPAYDTAFDGFAAPAVQGDPKARQAWAADQVKLALTASMHMGIGAHETFSGALAWLYIYPWPQRPAGVVETAFDELAKRWLPILDHAEACGVDVVPFLISVIEPGDAAEDVLGGTFVKRRDNCVLVGAVRVDLVAIPMPLEERQRLVGRFWCQHSDAEPVAQLLEFIMAVQFDLGRERRFEHRPALVGVPERPAIGVRHERVRDEPHES